VQRLFSNFADGLPGGGILLLRFLAGGALIYRGITATSEVHNELVVLQAVGGAAGLLILGGLWTPVVGLLAGILEVFIGLSHPASHSLALIVAIVSISLAMIGPGAFSIDARLYGRKQLLPPDP
jgi:uncharacterized membrane protein YphA (DoxX/SURF4 family)